VPEFQHGKIKELRRDTIEELASNLFKPPDAKELASDRHW